MVIIFRNPQIVTEIKEKPQNFNFKNCKLQKGMIRYGIWWKRLTFWKEMKETEFIMKKLQGSELLWLKYSKYLQS